MMLKCSHWICRGCITVKFINALLTFPVASPNCCDGYPIPLRHAYQVLDQGFWEVFRKSLPVDAKVTARSGKWRFYKMFGGLPQKSLDETSNDVYIGEDDAGAGAAPASVAAATYRSSPTELSSRESWEVPYRAIHYGVKGPSMPSNQRTKRPQNAVPDFDSWLQSVKPGPPPPREFFT
ncbi:hypothetical protein QBC43DRAFT_13715 [Cladorrhinum sp. PSN259]|nr:hypothetical protein QBC43DRAFT_13715 [Cladorrhinum sp. PSN259]